MPVLALHTRHRILATYEQLKTYKATARKLDVNLKTVKHWVRRFKETGQVGAKRKKGRPRSMSDTATAAALQLLTTADMSLSDLSRKLHEEGHTSHRVHRVTVGRWVKKLAQSQGKRLRALTGKPRPALSEANKQARVSFARAHLRTDWATVMFTDRKKFLLRSPGSSVRPVTWTTGDRRRTASSVSRPVVVNLYAGLTVHGTTKCHLVTGTTGYKSTHYNKKGEPARNITASEYGDVVQNTLLPEGDRLFRKGGVLQNWVLQQDNDPTHRAAVQPVTAWSRGHSRSVQLLKDWPPNSPDLNMIENLWSIVDAKVKARGCKNASDFKQAVIEEMSAVPQDTITKLFASMEKRMKKVIECKGERLRS